MSNSARVAPVLITLDGREIYAGRLRGDGKDTHTMKGNGADMLDKGLDLGEYKKGDYGVLKFVVTADVGYLSAEDFVEVSQARIRWIFSAAKDEAAAPPDTGEIAKNGLYILLILLLLLCVVFYYRYRRLRGNC